MEFYIDYKRTALKRATLMAKTLSILFIFIFTIDYNLYTSIRY